MGRSPRVIVEPLGAHPDLIATTVAWHLDAFDPGGDAAFWTRARTEEARLAGIPCAWVAFADDNPVGTVSLIEHNMDTRRDLSPWLAALFVLPSHRGGGIGTALVHRCEHEAWRVDVSRLYLYTTTARGLYERLGWVPFTEEEYEGGRVTVMLRHAP
jgi:GNAT superfamily N-acetyltransferase